MTRHDWDARYRDDDLPWDSGSPEPHLIEFVQSHGLASGKALDVGCGTGTNSLWLAEQGFEVLGIDVSPTAIRRAERKTDGEARARFASLDFLKQDLPDGNFDLVFDRGCFHVFDSSKDRARFAERVARALAPDGVWVSIMGSTEGPPRDHGPPRRTARDLTNAIEPVLELVELRATALHPESDSPPRAWLCVARRRTVPAQPSTRR